MNNSQTLNNHLTVDNTVEDVVNHPVFTGFGCYILPLERRYDPSMKLSGIAYLLPFHNYVDPVRSVDYINKMIDMVNDGYTIYYGIGRRDAGLFFFPGKPGAPFAVICPGGGFSYVGSIHEGFPLAFALSQRGYNAFVLQYDVTGGAQTAVEDLAAGIDYIFRHASELRVSTRDYSVWGASAGARMAAYIGTYTPAAFGDYVSARPAVVVMSYTGHSEYSLMDPPTYMVTGSEDAIAPPYLMRRRAGLMKAVGIDTEFHEYPSLRHGFGLGFRTSAEGWENGAVKFWERHMNKTIKK